MKRIDLAGAVLMAVAAAVGASSSELSAQVRTKLGPAGGVVALSAGKSLVVAPQPKTMTADARMQGTAVQRFRRLPASALTEALQATGETAAPPASSSGPFTLSTRAPFVEGRGFLNGTGIGINGYSNVAQFFGDPTWIGVWSLGSPTTTRYMVHFQVEDIGSSTIDYAIKFMDGSSMRVPAMANQVQDILVLVALPNNSPLTSPHILASINRAGAGRSNLLGVEVTPM